MTQGKKHDEQSCVSYINNFRRNTLHIRPRKFFLCFIHFLAMNLPVHKLRIAFYKLRGTKIGKNVFIAHQVFLEEGHPELITIKENTDVGPWVMILTHDTVLSHLGSEIPSIRVNEVIIGKNCYIGAGAIILPGVTIGDNSIIAAGSVVTKSIPEGSVAMGVPAKVTFTNQEWAQKYLVNK